MSSLDEQEIEDGVFEDVEPPCVALVPVTPTVFLPRKVALTRPDASFVTQLLATAEHVPQTCALRRAAPADVLSAYRAFQHRVEGAGIAPRQVIKETAA
jgi:hypothetical protein